MNWKIVQLEYNNDDNQGVIVAHWDCTHVDGDYSARRYGSCSFTPDPDSDDYIEFDSLTEADVIGWVQASENQADIEQSITDDIEQQKNPATMKGLPSSWSEPPAEESDSDTEE